MIPTATSFDQLEARLKTLLPDAYQEHYDTVEPISMGSAGLNLGPDGKVAWDQMWASFCDLAMAGGPPHRGALLEPGSREDIAQNSDSYQEAASELCRGITLVTGLYAEQSPTPGWIQMYCTSAAMAEWLTRAIVMENVSATFKGLALYLPAGPSYRLEKEIKNVITAVAKTSHYWLDHTSEERQQAIANTLQTMNSESPLLQPGPTDGLHATHIADAIRQTTKLNPTHQYSGWLGIDCLSVRTAIWIMRLLVASNILSRREDTTVFLPLDPTNDPDGTALIQIFTRVQAFAKNENVL